MTVPSRTDTDAAAAERRLVTVLFADIVDSTSLAERMDPEDWREAIRDALAQMSAPVQRYGGTVVRLMGDGLLAIFGAPTVHEDDATRAVQAGLDMVHAVAEHVPRLQGQSGERLADRLRIRVGVNTGVAIVEGMGDGTRDVDALGDTVNVAARLQGAARAGTVLVTGNTWRHVSNAFRGTPLGGVSVKGKAEPVEAWEVDGRLDDPTSGRGIAGLHSPMVGRDDELAQLRPLLTAIEAGRGRGAVLLGEPGVGKSRLLSELRAFAGARWFEARCISYRGSVPYGLLGDLVTTCLQLSQQGTAAERAAALDEKLRALWDPLEEDLRASLAHLLSLPLDPDTADRFAPLSPQALRARYQGSLDILVRRLCGTAATVLVIEDTHWADASSVDVIGSLLPLAHELPVLLIVSSRPERSAPGWQLVSAARDTFGDALTEVALQPLPEGDSRVLVGNLLEIDSLPERLRASILARAEGNPFFVEELIRMLIERGWVVRSGDRWVGSGTVNEAEVPDTLRGLLLARLDRLPDDARRLLRIASVVGRDVPVRLLDAVVDDAAAAGRAMGLAEAAGLVRFVPSDAGPAYRFRHALIQEAAYDSLLKADRRRLHRQVGEALESLEVDRREELAPILGLHFERAGWAEKAVEHLHAAGRTALRRQASREARELLDRAAHSLDDAPETPELDRKRVEVAIDRAAAGVTFIPVEVDLAILGDARTRAERLGDERLLGLVLAREVGTRALGEWLTGQISPEFAQALERATEIGRRLDDPEILAHTLAVDGLRMVVAGRRREAIELLGEAAELLERFVVNEASFYTGQLAMVHADLGELDVADRLVARAAVLAERSEDPKAIADAAIFRGFVLGMEGRFEEGVALAAEGYRIATTIDEVVCRTAASMIAGEIELASGKLTPAIDWLETSTGLARSCDPEGMGVRSQISLVAARAFAGQGRSALEGLDGLLERARAYGDPLTEARLLLHRGEANAQLADGDRDQARRDLTSAIAMFRDQGARPYLEHAERVAATLG